MILLYAVAFLLLMAAPCTSYNAIQRGILDLQKVSNGFDIRGIVDESLDAKRGPKLTNDMAFYIGKGFANHVSRKNGGRPVTIGVGRDVRRSGERLSRYFAAGVSSVDGCRAVCAGLSSTPAMFWSTQKQLVSDVLAYGDATGCDVSDGLSCLPFDAAVSITASHLPTCWNGLKLYTSDTSVGIGEEGIADLVSSLTDENCLAKPHAASDNGLKIDFIQIYNTFLKSVMTALLPETSTHRPLEGLKIALNPGNGVGYFLLDVLSDLGADLSPSINTSPDDLFPNHPSNPEDKECMAATREAVLVGDADIGIALDCDADRCGLVCASGNIINRNNLIALVAKMCLTAGKKKSYGLSAKRSVIVTDSATSNQLTRYIQSSPLNGQHVRYKKGYRYVIELARATENCVAGFECSGHGAFRENLWVDDGSYTALRAVALLQREKQQQQQQRISGSLACSTERYRQSLERGGAEGASGRVYIADIIKEYADPLESIELRCDILGGYDAARGGAALCIECLQKLVAGSGGLFVEETPSHEGMRVSAPSIGDGWLMIRASLHEPVLSIQVESDAREGCKVMLRELLSRGFRRLEQTVDLGPVLAYAALD